MVSGSRVRVHIVGENPKAAGLDDRFFVIFLEVFGAEWAYVVFYNLLYDVFIFAVRPRAGVF